MYKGTHAKHAQAFNDTFYDIFVNIFNVRLLWVNACCTFNINAIELYV